MLSNARCPATWPCAVPAAAAPESGGCAPPGSILSAGRDGIVIACGEGTLRVSQLQADGRKRMDAAAFLAGHALRPGDRLGLTNA